MSRAAFKSFVWATPFLTNMCPVRVEMLVTPPVDWFDALAFRNPAIAPNCWLMLAPEYLTFLKFTSAVPLRARMISAELKDFTGPAARISMFIVPSPLTLSSEVTPYALAIAKIAGSCAFEARAVASTDGEGEE